MTLDQNKHRINCQPLWMAVNYYPVRRTCDCY